MTSQKPSAGLDDAARLLDLVPFLLSHQGISIAELAKKFFVTPEEITSDLTTLWMCGLPGYTAYELIDLSFDSGFVTISNAQTLDRPRALERNEALALLLGLETLLEEISSTNADLASSIAHLIEKISVKVGESAALRVKAGSPTASALRAKISEAMDSRAFLRISYHSSAHDEIGERIIEPLEFSSVNEMEYLEAFCQSSNGFRTFRMDRIISAQIHHGVEVAPKVDSNVSEPATIAFSLRVLDRARDVFERFSLNSLSLASLESTREIPAQSFSSEWTLREVMSLGGAVAISSPESLRSAVRDRAQRTLAGYSNPSY